MNDFCAVCGTDRLMTETDAEDRDTAAELLHGLDDDAGILRSSGAGRENDVRGGKCLDLRDGHRVVPDHADLIGQRAEILIQIIGKAVVIINQQDH